MSSRHHRGMCCDPMIGGYGGGLFGGCGFNFSYILILLLIALQFSRRDGIITGACTDSVVGDPGLGAGAFGIGGGRGLIDNSVLFILAFYLLVCGCGIGGRGGCGCGCGGFGGRFY